MSLGRRVLDSNGWTALSVGEDWEYSVSLLLGGEGIHFNGNARVLARESTGLAQASTQRLRWASGRHAVAGSGGWTLFTRGVRERRLVLCDAALNLAAPTYSVQATLALLCMVATYLLPHDAMGPLLSAWSVALTESLAAYFLVGVVLTESPGRALAGLVLVPVFLPWRMAIELLGLLGYGRRHWGGSNAPRGCRPMTTLASHDLSTSGSFGAPIAHQAGCVPAAGVEGPVDARWDPHCSRSPSTS